MYIKCTRMDYGHLKQSKSSSTKYAIHKVCHDNGTRVFAVIKRFSRIDVPRGVFYDFAMSRETHFNIIWILGLSLIELFVTQSAGKVFILFDTRYFAFKPQCD